MPSTSLALERRFRIRSSCRPNRIFVALLTICLLGFAVDRLFRLFVDRVLARYMAFVSVS